MLQTCKSCGTVFEIDEGLLSTNVKWLKCSVCNQKWNVSKEGKKDFDNDIIETKNHKSNDQSLKVRQDLASIKSVVEKKTKTMSLQKSSALEQKNKTVVEIASELSASKLKPNDKSVSKPNKKSRFRKVYFLYFVISLIMLTAMVIFFRPLILAYTYFYFPKYADFYSKQINLISLKIKSPILVELNYLNLKDFVATSKDREIKFSGMITNDSKRPILVPRIKILAVREDRKIILEKILVLDPKIIKPNSMIKFQDSVQFKSNNENISVKVRLLKELINF
ncbi:zinc-ribbon domain-containing protein [Alphaproteobacteria bacterium]|nr:zinc-ribbon domain-containing protein [Alphaproteobacteria bacterium]